MRITKRGLLIAVLAGLVSCLAVELIRQAHAEEITLTDSNGVSVTADSEQVTLDTLPIDDYQAEQGD